MDWPVANGIRMRTTALMTRMMISTSRRPTDRCWNVLTFQEASDSRRIRSRRCCGDIKAISSSVTTSEILPAVMEGGCGRKSHAQHLSDGQETERAAT
jgi:hypothetical protein